MLWDSIGNHENITKYFTENTSSFLLNTNIKSYDLMEKYVDDIVLFHTNRLNLKYSDIFVEFWWKNKTDKTIKMRLECDNTEKNIYPLLTCITFLNDHLNPVLITDINLEKYKYKMFEEENKIFMIFPKKNQHICFDGSKYYGIINNTNEIVIDQYTLGINIWDKSPSCIEYYKNKQSINSINNFTLIPNNNKKEIIVENKLTYSFYDKLLYKNIFNPIFDISTELQGVIYITDSVIIKNETSEKDKIDKIINDFTNMQMSEIKHNNRFLQRFIYEKIYNPSICEWIILESEKYAKNNGGWIIQNINPILLVESITTIFNFVLLSLSNIFEKITKSYCISKEISYNIKKIFIIKYNLYTQYKYEMHKDDSCISINIILSNSTKYEGGGILFEDSLYYNLDQGDILINSGQTAYTEKNLIKGDLYVLKILIDLKI